MLVAVDHPDVETGFLRHISKLYPDAFIPRGLAGNSAGDQQANNYKHGRSTESHVNEIVSAKYCDPAKVRMYLEAYNYGARVRQARGLKSSGTV